MCVLRYNVDNDVSRVRTCVQALTAEMNMHSSRVTEDKHEMTQLRNEVYEWKQKYYECRRKVVAL